MNMNDYVTHNLGTSETSEIELCINLAVINSLFELLPDLGEKKRWLELLLSEAAADWKLEWKRSGAFKADFSLLNVHPMDAMRLSLRRHLASGKRGSWATRGDLPSHDSAAAA